MNLVGNPRGGANDLARHLLNTHDNETVRVIEVSGFVSRSLSGALNEAYALSRGTRCQQFLFSLSLNPPAYADVSDDEFKDAADSAGKNLGLSDQPRSIVIHEKLGHDGTLRRHAHAVWSRIDTDNMKAIHLSYHKRRLQDVSRELFRKHGWEIPKGHENPIYRNPRNFTLQEWQQAKRAKKDPKALKGLFQECWAQSDSNSSFAAALREHGLVLARGDKRGHVAVDYQGEVYPVSRWTDQKAKDVRARLG